MQSNLIISSTKEYFFSGCRSLGDRYSRRFTSSSGDHPDEPEVPASMMALVATAVSIWSHSCVGLTTYPQIGLCMFARLGQWHLSSDRVQFRWTGGRLLLPNGLSL